MDNDQVLRRQLLARLRGEGAHMSFEEAVADFPLEKINQRPPNIPYSPWELLEHIRIAQWDILDFIRNPDYVEMEWPKAYWPEKATYATQAQWQKTIQDFQADRAELEAILEAPETDLFAALFHGPQYTILREILLVIDHNGYHLGEFGALRGVLDAWPEGH